MPNPYSDLPARAFWSPSVAKKHMNDISELWQAPYPISQSDRYVTFGSCFAQHFSRALVKRGLNWIDCEQAPAGMAPDVAKTFNYGVSRPERATFTPRRYCFNGPSGR